MPDVPRRPTSATRRRAGRQPRPTEAVPLTQGELGDWVTRYFEVYRSAVARMQGEATPPPVPDARRPVWELSEMIGSESRDDLETAWQIALALVERAPDDGALSFVAAGPVEELVMNRHAELGDRILDEARRNAAFRRALTGIWGWDGLPEPFRKQLMAIAGIATPDG